MKAKITLKSLNEFQEKLNKATPWIIAALIILVLCSLTPKKYDYQKDLEDAINEVDLQVQRNHRLEYEAYINNQSYTLEAV